MQGTAPDDASLVARARGGDLDAFEQLVREHTQAVYAHALRFFGDPNTAEDVVQEVFIKVYRSIDSFSGSSAFSTWLYRVTRNVCLDMLRSTKRRPQPIDTTGLLIADPVDLESEAALTYSVEAAMAWLAPEDRDALSAVALFGLTYAEAAEALGVPVGTVKSRVFRARRIVIGHLDRQGGGE